MHDEQFNQFLNELSEKLLEAKLQALAPIVNRFIEQIELQGFPLDEILLALSEVVYNRRLGETNFHLDNAARAAARALRKQKLQNTNSKECK